MSIRKPTQNFIIDIASLVAMTLIAATGLLIRYTLPPGQGHGRTVLGLTRHEWGGIHFWIAVLLLALLVIHLVLHWKWIVTMIRGKVADTAPRRVRIGVAVAAILLLLLLSPFLLPVETRGVAGEDHREQVESGPGVAEQSLASEKVGSDAR